MTASFEFLTRDPVSRRDLFLLRVAHPADLAPITRSLGHFVCLLIWDASTVAVDVVATVAERLLGSGCVYVCAWGDGCGRVHDIFDEVIVGDGTQVGTEGAIHVMTSWHENETLDSAIWFFLRSADPDEHIREECHSAVAIVIGGDADRSAAVGRALRDPVEFSRRMMEACD